MTLYGWDASSYDGPLSTAVLAKARGEGIAFFTHKVGEGTSYDDPTDLTALAAARDAGVEFIGGYLVPRSNAAVSAQVDYWLKLANRDEPWWRTFPGWFWQIDLEKWPNDAVSAATDVAAAQELRRRTERLVVLYASHGQYGNSLSAWDGPLWNAHYVNHAAAGFAAMYPGDNWTPALSGGIGGWAAYSGKAPIFLQYTSSATIAGLTTCDANAYRGSVDQLRALITGGTDMLKDDPDGLWQYPRIEALALLQPPGEGPEKGQKLPGVEAIKRIDAGVAALQTQLAALTAAFTALASGGTSIDTAAVLAHIDQAATAESATVQALRAEIAELHTARAAAAQAEVTALTKPAA